MAVFAVYAPVRGYAYVPYDDLMFVADPALQSGFSPEGLRWAFTTFRGISWMPLTWLSFFADASWNGLAPGAVHLTQLFLHAASTVVLFAALRRLTGASAASAAVAALFGLHPVNVESVAWVSEREGVLSGLFWMIALWIHAGTGSGDASPGRRVALAIAAAGALLSKPVAVTLPFVLLLLDFWPLRRLGGASGVDPALVGLRVTEKVPLFALSFAVAIVTVVGQRRAGAIAPLDAIGIPERLANAVVAYGSYLRTFFWPCELAVLYPYVLRPEPVVLLGSLAVLAAVSVLAIRQRHGRPWLLVGWGWFLATLVPMIGIVQVGSQAHADRYAYLPTIGLALAVVWSIREWARTRRRQWLAGAVAAVVVAALSSTAAVQRAYWSDGVTLFTHTLRVVGSHPIVHEQLGMSLLADGRVSEGREHLERSFELRPQAALANNLAWSYATHPDPALRRPGRALELARFALRKEENVPEYLCTLAAAHAASGRFERAAQVQQQAIAAARAAGRTALLEDFEESLRLYTDGRVYVEPPTAAWQIP